MDVLACLRLSGVSIHAPARGDEGYLLCLAVRPFQSTLPHEGTSDRKLALEDDNPFQSTLPHGGDK